MNVYILFVVVDRTNLGRSVLLRKEHGQHSTESKKVLHFKRIRVGVVGRLVVVEHQVNRVRGGTEEENLEESII